MHPGLREFLNSKAGYATSASIILLAIVYLGLSLRSAFTSEIANASTRRVFVCSETGKAFEVTLKPGMTIPVKSPYSGKDTGYEFNEVCGWTADGKVANKPTYVLLNRTVGKPGPTFCPDCNRLVVADNPPAEPDRKPPPTESEYRSSANK